MIQLQGVSYTYPDSACPALQGIDLTVPDGEWLLMAGPSGGGKSTLLYLLNGLVPHILGGEVRGDVEVNGLVPANVPVRELSRQVGTVFQNPETQLFMLRVGEDVAFGCENLGLPPWRHKAEWSERARRFPSRSLRNQEVFTLSGGQKQRLAIAGALAMGCRTLLLDEPTSDLDERAVRICLRSCAICTKQGTRSSWLSIAWKAWRGLVDRVVTIHDGRIISNGTFPAEKPLCRRKPVKYADGFRTPG